MLRIHTIVFAAAGWLSIHSARHFSQSPPPTSFDRPGASFYSEAQVPGSTFKISIDVSYSMAQRSLDYQYAYAGLPERLTDDRSFAVDYWPTACNKGPSHTTYVVGKGYGDDSFVAEVWRFQAPTLLPGRLTPGGTMTPPKIKMGNRTSVMRVHNSIVAAGTPRAVVQLKGSTPEAFLVYFDGSREIYSVDASAGSMSLVVSPTPAPGVLIEPSLQEAWKYFYVREHAADGYVYVARQGSDAAPEAGSILLLIDSDKDGDLDSTQVITQAIWRTLGYHNPHVWVGEW